MASAFDTRILQNLHDTPLSALAGPPPTRVVPVHHGLGRDSWSSNSNIWQTTPRLLEHLSIDERPAGFPVRNNRATTADVSKPVAGASTDMNHNTTQNSNKGLQIAPVPTTLTSRSIGSLPSPTKSRNNATIGTARAGMTMTSLGQSSLLPGSAPDVESSVHSSSSSAFVGQRGLTIRRNFRQFNVRDAEEFVPSHLRAHERQINRPSALGNNGRFGYQDGMSGAILNVSHSNQDVSPAKNWDQSVDDYFQPSMISSTRAAFNHDRSASRDRHPSAFDSNGAWSSSFGAVPPNNSTANIPIAIDFRLNHRVEGSRRTSNLRPDVASYHPTNLNVVATHSAKPDDGKHAYGPISASRTETGNERQLAANQYAAWTNSNRFNANSATGVNSVYSAYGNGQPQGLMLAEPRSSINDSRHAKFAYRSSGIPVQTELRTRCLSGSGSVPYGSIHYAPQYPYGPEASHMTIYQQPYVSGTDANESAYYPEPSQQTEYESPANDVSEILKEFRTHHRSRKYELKDIYGHIVEFSGDQNGSRFIQTKIEQANSDEKEQIFAELQTNARQLMTDVFGNYVIQKMFDYGSQSQKKALASHMQGYMFAMSTQAYGCRCVQKAFEHILTDQQAALIKELEGRVMEVTESQHGNHVIQKAIECIPSSHIQFIVDAHKNQVVRLAKHIYGCRIIQRMLEYCEPHVKRSVLDELHYDIPRLIDDQYGNYVIQCIIKRCGPLDRYRVIEEVRQRVLYYSMHKFASNVVEKAIAHADDQQLFDMIQRVVSPIPEGTNREPPIAMMLQDQYGNYVMQTVLKTVQGPRKRKLADEIRHRLHFVGKQARGTKQTMAMADLVNTIIAENSPSSASTGPQTPHTPNSLNSAGGMATPLTKAMEMVPAGYPIRDAHRDILAFKSMHE